MITGFLKNQTIGMKISVLVALSLILMASLVTLSLLQIKAIGSEINTLAAQDIQIIKSLGRISVFTNKHSHHLAQVITLGKRISDGGAAIEKFKAQRAIFHQYGQKINQEIQNCLALLVEISSKKYFAEKMERSVKIDYELRGIHKEFADYQFLAERILNLLFLSKLTKANVELLNIDKEINELDQGIENLLVEIEFFTLKSTAHARQIERSALVGMLFISIFILSLSLLLGVTITRSISKPIIKLKNTAEKIGKGQLGIRVEISSRDEIGSLANSFNKMAEDLATSTAALTSSKDYLDNILKSMIDSLIVINPDSTIRSVNQATLTLLGYQEQELLGQPIASILLGRITEKEKLFDGLCLEDKLKEDSIQGIEINYTTKDKRQIPVLFSGAVMKGNDGKIQGIVCVAQDLSERKQAEIQIQQTNAKLVAANNELIETQYQLVQSAKLASLGELATGVAHELNQPLAIISFNADLRLNQVRKGQYDKVVTTYELILKQVERAATIINHLREFGREAGSIPHSPHAINQIIEESFIIFNEQLRMANIEVVKELADNLSLVRCNPIEIEQVLTNLFVNAKDALESVDSKNIIVRTHQRHGNVVIEIEDSGMGISASNQRKIFDPFFTTKEIGKGTGLGLSISYGIVKSHGGQLSVSSQEGQGAIFEIALPV